MLLPTSLKVPTKNLHTLKPFTGAKWATTICNPRHRRSKHIMGKRVSQRKRRRSTSTTNQSLTILKSTGPLSELWRTRLRDCLSSTGLKRSNLSPRKHSRPVLIQYSNASNAVKLSEGAISVDVLKAIFYVSIAWTRSQQKSRARRLYSNVFAKETLRTRLVIMEKQSWNDGVTVSEDESEEREPWGTKTSFRQTTISTASEWLVVFDD